MFITSKRRYSGIGNIQFVGPSYFGNGSDGALITSGAFLLTPNASNDMIVKNYTSIHIGFENMVSASAVCAGLLFYVTGDCIISGSLSMTGKAYTNTGSNDITLFRPTDTGSAQPSSSYLLGWGLDAINAEANQGFISNVGINRTIKKFGGAGGIGATNIGSDDGTSGSYIENGAGGGGGGGYYIMTFPSTNGASGSYGGGGTGGRGSAQSPATYTAGGFGGGNIVLIVKGNVIVTSLGSITANGGKGQDGSNLAPSQAGAGGGGGGTITILYGGSYTNNGIVSVNGGLGGLDGGVNVGGGGDGGTGSLFIAKIKI